LYLTPFLFTFGVHFRIYLYGSWSYSQVNECMRGLKKSDALQPDGLVTFVLLKSKSHGADGRTSSFQCVVSATFKYYSGSFNARFLSDKIPRQEPNFAFT